ncbi:ClbS/DfsB family four-helix bundle protein, partial [Salmonella enterica]|nr:ClbS/DfsB family four-helix bundle protein [Salmonella enterica]
MGVPQTKSELLNAMDKDFSKLIGYLNAIPSELLSEKSMEGHAKDTMMSVRDLIS